MGELHLSWNPGKVWVVYDPKVLKLGALSVGIEPLKTRHNVKKLDLIIPLLSLLRIDIDLSIQLISITLYMNWVH